jgi:hypothetical protein
MKTVFEIRNTMIDSMMATDAIQKTLSAMTTAQHAAVRAGVRFDYDAAASPMLMQQKAAREIYRQACSDLEKHGEEVYDKTYELVRHSLISAGIEI